ncbi:MAG TPA: APC family permease [Nocardioidaceae bacterium]|jgi:APA family basic amino acid/polyamine antiporter
MTETSLARRLGVGDAVVVGLSAMVGAGVFAAFAPAAEAAGSLLLVGLGLAAVVAYCNATSSAQLAAQYPSSGGTYVYGRERLGEWWGFLAGWGFVVGKTASCAAMALTFAAYAVDGPEWVQRLVALVAVVALTAVNYRGITKTSGLARVLLAVTLVALVVGVAGIVIDLDGTSHLSDGEAWTNGSAYGVLQSAGLLFFAFAGYARIATLGEEVRDPETTIPRAIPLALGIAVVLYAVVGVVLLVALGPDRLAASVAPLDTAASDVAAWLGWLVRVGAVAGALGALLALVAGVGRTTLAMARGGDLPRFLDRVHPRHQVPHRAEVAVGAVVGLLVLTTDLRGVIGFSSFGVLLYYAVANASALTQTPGHRRWPKGLQVLGLVGCLVLVAALPWQAVVAGVSVFVVGVVARLAGSLTR